MANESSIVVNFVGDVMLGRLIDQALPVHVHEPEEARIVDSFKRRHVELVNYDHTSPWGSTLPLFKSADVNIINLETSVTSTSQKWPDKVFNYRMHPENIKALKPPNVTYASLANNHTLDFSEQGLIDTVNTMTDAGVAFAGAGLTADEAKRPAILPVSKQNASSAEQNIYVWSASDHPSDWDEVPMFHLIDYSESTRQHLKKLVQTSSNADPSRPPSLKVFSVHWGPNYAWHPDTQITGLAHYLIDECGIDIVHGHSSHHIQGIELYHGKLIIYGCGDFVDDYALVADYRNDLSAIWRVCLRSVSAKLELDSLEVFPTRIKQFQAQRLSRHDDDHAWTCEKVKSLSSGFGVQFEAGLGQDDQLRVLLH